MLPGPRAGTMVALGGCLTYCSGGVDLVLILSSIHLCWQNGDSSLINAQMSNVKCKCSHSNPKPHTPNRGFTVNPTSPLARTRKRLEGCTKTIHPTLDPRAVLIGGPAGCLRNCSGRVGFDLSCIPSCTCQRRQKGHAGTLAQCRSGVSAAETAVEAVSTAIVDRLMSLLLSWSAFCMAKPEWRRKGLP